MFTHLTLLQCDYLFWDMTSLSKVFDGTVTTIYVYGFSFIFDPAVMNGEGRKFCVCLAGVMESFRYNMTI